MTGIKNNLFTWTEVQGEVYTNVYKLRSQLLEQGDIRQGARSSGASGSGLCLFPSLLTGMMSEDSLVWNCKYIFGSSSFVCNSATRTESCT